MEGEKSVVKPHMACHLQALMVDMELYRWNRVRTFHAVWLNQLEQGRVTWGDEEAKRRFRWTLIWHQAMTTTVVPAIAAHSCSADEADARHKVYNILAKPGSKACVDSIHGDCSDGYAHPGDLHA